MGRTLDEILATEKPEIVKEAKKKADDILIDIRLAKLREHMNLTQTDIAATLNVRQPTVSEMEKQGHNLRLSSIKRYVEASGGKLHLNVEFPDGTNYGFPV